MAYLSMCISMALFLSSMAATIGQTKDVPCLPCRCSEEMGLLSANCTGLNLSHIPGTIPSSTRTLLFANNNLTTLEEISTFPNLTILNLTSNSITALSESIFEHTPLIREINLSNCRLRSIEPNVFSPLKQIEVLDISENPLIGWQGVKHATYGLQDSALKILYMNKIIGDLTICNVVRFNICDYLRNTSLTVLHSDRNRIEMFNDRCFGILPKTLRTVSLKENRLTLGKYMKGLPLLTGLDELDISDKAGLNSLPDLNDLVTNGQQCQDEQSCLETDESKMFSSMALSDFVEFPFYNIPPNLTRFKCSYMKLSYHINSVRISNNSLVHLDISSNLLSTWHGPVYGLENLLHLNLGNNVARKYSVDFFKTFPKLQSLDLSRNFLGNSFSKDDNGTTFSMLSCLESLNLSHSLIPLLPERIFIGLPSLRILDISHNYIHRWYFDIKHMNNLNVINASSNRIRWLFLETRQTLDRLHRRTNSSIRVDLSENPLDCTCENIPFLTWLLNNRIIFGNFRNYSCLYSNGHMADIGNVTQFQRVFGKLQDQCSNSFVLNFVSVSLSLFAVFMLVSGIAYRYRWKLRYWYYSAKLRKTEANGPDTEYTCDAFVSYADEDMDFVNNHLKAVLEEESGLNMIIRDRDFNPNESEIKNIVNAVHVCRKTVLILSDNFFKRFLCEKELEMAHYEQIETQRNIIIIVMYRQPTIKALPPEIHYKLKSDSYIEYPTGDEDKTCFWQKLLEAIRKDS